VISPVHIKPSAAAVHRELADGELHQSGVAYRTDMAAGCPLFARIFHRPRPKDFPQVPNLYTYNRYVNKRKKQKAVSIS
jgi:hypothetical protein